MNNPTIKLVIRDVPSLSREAERSGAERVLGGEAERFGAGRPTQSSPNFWATGREPRPRAVPDLPIPRQVAVLDHRPRFRSAEKNAALNRKTTQCCGVVMAYHNT